VNFVEFQLADLHRPSQPFTGRSATPPLLKVQDAPEVRIHATESGTDLVGYDRRLMDKHPKLVV
jgi:hypothetical protein